MYSLIGSLFASLSNTELVALAASAALAVAFIIIGSVLLAQSRKPAARADKPAEKPVPVEDKLEEEPAPAEEEPAEEPTEEPAPVEEEIAPVVAEEPIEEEPAEEPAEEPVAEEPVEEPAPVEEEPVEEPAPVEEEPVEPVIVPVAEEAADEENVQEEVEEISVDSEVAIRYFTAEQRRTFSTIRYDRSFEARLIQSSDQTKSYYEELKHELLSYAKVKARKSWKQESFRCGKKLIALLAVRGKTLCIYLALDPAAYEEGKYHVEDVSERSKYADVPCLYRIRNDRRCRYAKELIAAIMQREEIGEGKEPSVEKVGPYEETEALLERKLIKLTGVKSKDAAEEVAVVEEPAPVEEPVEETPVVEEPAPVEEEPAPVEEPVEETPVEEEPAPAPVKEKPVIIPVEEISVSEAKAQMNDEEAEAYIEVSERFSNKSKQAIVNVDTLGEYFESGEKATLETMKERIPYITKKTTYIKVLARGRLNKAIEVEADDFSLDAVKMIVLAGGKVYRTQSNR